MNYVAADDPLFEDGHYVEEWELRHWQRLSLVVRSFVEFEAARGNKVTAIGADHVFLARPPTDGLLALPEGLAFVCPYRASGVPFYDGDEDGLLMNVHTGEYLRPTGTERRVHEV
jgi:hypothetical protein